MSTMSRRVRETGPETRFDRTTSSLQNGGSRSSQQQQQQHHDPEDIEYVKQYLASFAQHQTPRARSIAETAIQELNNLKEELEQTPGQNSFEDDGSHSEDVVHPMPQADNEENLSPSPPRKKRPRSSRSRHYHHHDVSVSTGSSSSLASSLTPKIKNGQSSGRHLGASFLRGRGSKHDRRSRTRAVGSRDSHHRGDEEQGGRHVVQTQKPVPSRPGARVFHLVRFREEKQEDQTNKPNEEDHKDDESEVSNVEEFCAMVKQGQTQLHDSPMPDEEEGKRPEVPVPDERHYVTTTTQTWNGENPKSSVPPLDESVGFNTMESDLSTWWSDGSEGRRVLCVALVGLVSVLTVVAILGFVVLD